MKCISGLLLISLSLISSGLKSQVVKERKHIQGGNELWKNFTAEMYTYEAFKPASIAYKDGQLFSRPVNYNRMLKTIQFIDEKGDTLAIADENAIKQITVENDQFIYNPLCLKSVAVNEKIRVFKHEEMKIADIRRKGALGIPNGSAAIESINQVYTSMNSFNLDINELLLLSKTTTYYLLTAEGDAVLATRKNLLAQFPQHKSTISNFVEKNKISFSNEKDLTMLASFIERL